jgi:hypothetical protein
MMKQQKTRKEDRYMKATVMYEAFKNSEGNITITGTPLCGAMGSSAIAVIHEIENVNPIVELLVPIGLNGTEDIAKLVRHIKTVGIEQLPTFDTNDPTYSIPFSKEPLVCPITTCGSDMIEVGTPNFGEEMWRIVECHTCGFKWDEVYTFSTWEPRRP